VAEAKRGSGMDDINVLLVDDEREFVELLAQRLEKRGFQAVAAFDGDEALAKLSRQEFDVVVLDVVMPGKDGIQTLREMKSSKPLTEVIMLSGHASLETAIEGMQHGAFDFLVKPPDMGDLVEKINRAFVRKSEHEERIRKAGFVREQLEDGAGRVEATTVRRPAAEPSTIGVETDLGRLLVIGRESDFSRELIEYALEMSKRMSYEIVALNTAGFNNESFKLFPAARRKVCEDFKEISEKNAALFRKAAQKEQVPFVHVVKFSERDEAIAEIRREFGDVDYVISVAEEGSSARTSRGRIVAYCPV
jgi:DNA-binding NtrC family response regulator